MADVCHLPAVFIRLLHRTITNKSMSTIYDQRRHDDLLQGLGSEHGTSCLFSHGWPLTADAWESQMSFLADTASVASDMIAADMAVRASRGMEITWISTPMI
jgi:hypothetical protein